MERMKKSAGFHKKKIVYLTITVTCVMIIVSMFLVQAFSPLAPLESKGVEASNQVNDSLPAIPLVILLLPIAAGVAFVFEWRNSRKNRSSLHREN
jgi:hypothetical protein